MLSVNNMPTAHHKEVAQYLNGVMPGKASVIAYQDNTGKCPIPIGQFSVTGGNFYSTIGAFDTPKRIPAGDYEFAACGSLAWLPNAIASSIYWLRGRQVDDWPLVCEEAVRHNVRSPYRHMVYVPSPFTLALSTGQNVKWLLGVPVSDTDISLEYDKILEKARNKYPEWLFEEDA